MPQGPDLSKSIRTMKKDIDRARRGGPDEGYTPPVFPAVNLASPKPELGNKPEIKSQAGQSSSQVVQAQKLAEEKQRVEKLRIEEQQKRALMEKARQAEEEKKEKIEDQKKEAEKQRKTEEEKKKKEEEDRKKREQEEQKRKESEEETKKERLRELFLKEDLSAKKRLILDERKKIDQEKSGINMRLKEILNLKRPLEAEKDGYLKKINYLKESHGQLSKKEAETENEKRRIEEKESVSLNDEEKKKIEKERWKIEEKRRETEKRRWTIEENIKLLESRIQDFDLKYWPIKEKEDVLKDQTAGLQKKEEDLKARIKEVDLKEEFRSAEETKKLIDKKISQFENKAGDLSKKLEAVLNNEKFVEKEEKEIEEKEKTASDLKQRKEIEEKRWLIEKQRRDIEKQRWQFESDKKEIDFDSANALKILDNLKTKSENIFSELLKLQPLSGEGDSFWQKYEKKSEPEKEIFKKPAMEEIKVEVKKEVPVIFTKVGPAPEEKKIEKPKMDSLKEEIVLPEPKPPEKDDVKKWQKAEDDKKLAEEERKKTEELKRQKIIEEKEGIEITSPINEYDIKEEPVFIIKPEPVEIDSEPSQPQVKPQSWPQIQSQLKAQPQIKQQAPYNLPAEPMRAGAPAGAKQPESRVSPLTSDILAVHPLPKKSGLPKKIFARALSIILLAALLFLNITFWYWYIFVRPENNPPVVVNTSPTPSPECIADKDCLSGKICTQEGRCGDKPIIVLGPIFPIAEEKEFKISSYSDIPGIILNVISEWPNEEGFAVDKFRRIVIIDESERRQVTIKEIFDALLITVPDGFYERLGENYTFFEYSQKEGIRIGLVSSIIDKENFAKLLSQNEGTMKDGFRTFFSLMNLESPVTTKAFASASKVKGYTGPDFRYLPVSKNDLGVCYSAYADYFILSTSFESMKKALESLKNQLTASPSPSASPSVLPTVSPSATPK